MAVEWWPSASGTHAATNNTKSLAFMGSPKSAKSLRLVIFR
jgi:hypothetical protein